MPHLTYLAIGFPPAVKSCTLRMRETANLFCEHGWDVTVVTIEDEAWEREFGVDHTLSEAVHPRVHVRKLPLRREDLDPDIRNYSELRARNPMQWRKESRQRELESFPEPVFGSWRTGLEEGVLEVHAEAPADLFLVSPAPNTGLAAAWRLWSEHGVPYAIDYRDAWSLNTYQGVERFSRESAEGQWESKVIEHAHAVWCVNDAIAGFYRDRYPAVADRISVVQNGHDSLASTVAPRRPGPQDGLTFGFMGTANFPAEMLLPVIEGWRAARSLDPIIGRSRLVFRGYFGTAILRGTTRHAKLINDARADGVSYRGPVLKSDIGATYAEWDGLLLLIPGGRYVTAGKTYEYVATGLPVMSVHATDHGASAVLRDYPLWVTPPEELDADSLARSFLEMRRLVSGATDDQRAEAAEHAARYERRSLLRPAVRELADSVVPLVESGR